MAKMKKGVIFGMEYSDLAGNLVRKKYRTRRAYERHKGQLYRPGARRVDWSTGIYEWVESFFK